MGHAADNKKQVYEALAERLSRAPEGAKVNEEFIKLLQSLYKNNEAEVASKFNTKPMTIEEIVEVTGSNEADLKEMLTEMSYRGLIIDIPRKEGTYYMLVPFVIGFFEYTFMRSGDNVELKELARLFEEYFDSDGAFKTVAGADTKVMRTLVYENLMPLAVETEVLDYERATEIIRASGGGSISTCSCRHQASHLDKACDAPQDVCISLGGAAKWLISKNLAKPATPEELLEVLERTKKLGLVHLCDNVMNNPTYICSCCSCCCHMLRGVTEKNTLAFHPSNFIANLEDSSCIGCGLCEKKCPVNAIEMLGDTDETKLPRINNEICIGCGVCANLCPKEAIVMDRRESLHVPPSNIKEKLKKMAIENKRF